MIHKNEIHRNPDYDHLRLTEDLMNLHGDYIKRCAYIMTKDIALSEDMTQETFLSFFRHGRQYEGRASHKTYLYQVLLNHVRMHYRKAPRGQASLEGMAVSVEGLCSGQDHSFENGLVAEIDLVNALHQLPEDQRMVIWLHYNGNFRVSEIATILELGPSAVKMRLKRARERLKEILGEGDKHCNIVEEETAS